MKLFLLFELTLAAGSVDWLVQPVKEVASVEHDAANNLITLRNGLVSRAFTLQPAFGTIDFRLNASFERGGDQSLLRAIRPEAVIQLDNSIYAIGGLTQTSTFLAYLNRSDLQLGCQSDKYDGTFIYQSHEVLTSLEVPFPWKPGTRYSPVELQWPPKGVELRVTFALKQTKGLKAHAGVAIQMHYMLYDGVPLLAKAMTVSCPHCGVGDDIVIRSTTIEQLSVNAGFGKYLTHGSMPPGTDWGGAAQVLTQGPSPLLQAKTDQAHSAACEWQDDYAFSRNPVVPGMKDQGATEPALNCTYTNGGPGAHVNLKETFESFKAMLLVTDSHELGRQSLMRHRVTNLLAPHTTENPIFFHATDVSDAGFKKAIDQMAEVGFEMLIFSFGSGFRLETADPSYLAKIKAQVDYAKSKGIEVGGYDLICLDRGHGGYGGNVGDQWVTVNADGSLGADACFASGWYDKLHALVTNFINLTGLAMLETDGPYGGGECHCTNHSHHHGVEDSVYRQTQLQNAFYNQMRKLNVFVNQPDNYFMQGGSKTGMGYDENQYSLPRWQDITISRAGMYDDLYAHTPTQGWMFVPIGDYHAGGGQAAFEPLDRNIAEYNMALAQYFGAGVAACYRGDVLFQGDASKAAVTRWASFFKEHRTTLTQPIVHLRRADGQGWDGWLHVNPFMMGQNNGNGHEVGIAMLFNPTESDISTTISLPLYYTGLTMTAMISHEEAPAHSVTLERDYSVQLTALIPANGATYFIIRAPNGADDPYVV